MMKMLKLLLLLLLLLCIIDIILCDSDNISDNDDMNNSFENCTGGEILISPTSVPNTLSCFGNDIYHQFQDTVIETLSFRSISIGDKVLCGIQTNFTLYCQGEQSSYQQLNIPEDLGEVYHISVGVYQGVCAITTMSELRCWGDSGGIPGIVNSKPNFTLTEISVGGVAACGLKQVGSFPICWGSDLYKQVSHTPSNSPMQLISVGYFAVCGVSYLNKIVCWGETDNEIVKNAPTDRIDNYIALNVGTYVACSVNIAYELKCFGDDSFGQISQLPNNISFQSVSAGLDTVTCGVTVGGKIKCWGDDKNNNNITNSFVPSQLRVVNVHVTEHIACGIVSKRCIKCWRGTYKYNETYCQDCCDDPIFNCTEQAVTSQVGVDKCDLCTPGSYCPTPTVQYNCPTGYYCPQGVYKPIICTLGSYCEGNSMEMQPCPRGWYCPSTSKAMQCPIGHYCPVGSVHPLGCLFGNYCPASSSSQDPCPAGYFCSDPSQKQPCDAGYWCDAGTINDTSTLCPSGFYCTAHTPMPKACSSGHYCIGEGHSNDGPLCNPGSYCPTPNEIKSCPAGYYCPRGSVNPIECDDNNFCPANSGSQTKCSLCPLQSPLVVEECTRFKDIVCGISIDNRHFQVPWALLFGFLGLGLLVLALSKLFKKKHPNSHPLRLFAFIFSVVDFISDIIFTIHVNSLDLTKYFIWSLIIIVISILIQGAIAFKICSKWLNRVNFQAYVSNRPLSFAIFFSVAMTNIESLLICSSKFLNYELFSAPLNKKDELEVERHGSFGILFETIPQLIVQILVALDQKELSGAIGFALFISLIQLIVAISKYVFLFLLQFKAKKLGYNDNNVNSNINEYSDSDYQELEEDNIYDELVRIRDENSRLKEENLKLKELLNNNK